MSTEADANEANQRALHGGHELLARAKLLRRQLAQQAAAARAEAKQAELEALLGQANAGDLQPLETWMAEFEAVTTANRPAHATPDNSAACETDPSDVTDASGDAAARDETFTGEASTARDVAAGVDAEADVDASGPQDDWAPLLPHALERLQQRVRQLNASTTSHQTSQISTRNTQGTRVARTKQPHRKSNRELVQLSKSMSAGLQDIEEQHQRVVSASRLRGIVASIVAHVLLILLLALVTLKLPGPPAGMSFSSASNQSPEQLEVSPTFETTTPDSAEETPEQPEREIDLAAELTQSSDAISQALRSAPVAQPSSSSSIASSASMSAANPLNANASFFGASASGNCFCYVIDGSGSMRDGPWEAAKIELLKSLASLKPKQRFYIIFFNRKLSAIPLPGEREGAPSALYATQENLEHARRWIDTLRIGIGAPPTKALETAIEKEPDAIYLLTDGVTKVDVPAFLRTANRISDLILGEQVRVPIHTIAFYSLEGQTTLQKIAAENRGQFIYVPDPRK